MKKNISIILLLFFISFTYAQEKQAYTDEDFTIDRKNDIFSVKGQPLFMYKNIGDGDYSIQDMAGNEMIKLIHKKYACLSEAKSPYNDGKPYYSSQQVLYYEYYFTGFPGKFFEIRNYSLVFFSVCRGIFALDIIENGKLNKEKVKALLDGPDAHTETYAKNKCHESKWLK